MEPLLKNSGDSTVYIHSMHICQRWAIGVGSKGGSKYIFYLVDAHWCENPFFGNLSFLSFLIKVIENGSKEWFQSVELDILCKIML